MGLDMYLSKRTYVRRWDHFPPERQFAVSVTRGGQPFQAIQPERVSDVIEQVGYWRKANQVHAWFVEHVQRGEDDCGEYGVSAAQLRQLLDEANAVLGRKKTPLEALPPVAGFFFGSVEIDDGYWEDLRDTKAMLEALLAEPGAEDADYFYRASW